jgi:hypothetical protein
VTSSYDRGQNRKEAKHLAVTGALILISLQLKVSQRNFILEDVWRIFDDFLQQKCIIFISVADPNPDPVGSGPYSQIRIVNHQIRIQIQLW